MNRSNEDDPMLREAALGKLDRGAPEVAARLRDDPAFARAVAELDSTRATTARVLREGAQLVEEAARQATPDDRASVLATIERLARDESTSRRRGRLMLLAGLCAAAVLAFFLLRPAPPAAAPRADVWMGTETEIRHQGESAGPGRLDWKVELLPGDELWLSFFALRDGARAELLLGPLDVSGNTAWQAKDAQERLTLSGDWQAELERRSAGEVELVGRVRYWPAPSLQP